MSKISPDQPNQPKTAHGSRQSYIIGFMLSVICTLIPYYLVTNKASTGNGLIALILGFALLQMTIQIFFFLHLGRGPKPLYNVVFFIATISLIGVIVTGSIVIINNLHSNMLPDDVTLKLSQDEGISQVGNQSTGACQELHTNHQVVITNGSVTPSTISAKLCDTLTFISQDSKRTIVFGSQPNDNYGGETEFLLYKKRADTITLNQLGTYTFYDQLDSKITGTFTVAR